MEAQAVVYAGLILADEGVAITAQKLDAVLEAAGVHVPKYWTRAFAKFFENASLIDMIANVSAAPAAGAAAPAAAAATEAAPAAAAAKEEDEEEDEGSDFGFGGLF